MINKAIVLDANILIRAVLGKRVRELLPKYIYFPPQALRKPPALKGKSHVRF